MEKEQKVTRKEYHKETRAIISKNIIVLKEQGYKTNYILNLQKRLVSLDANYFANVKEEIENIAKNIPKFSYGINSLDKPGAKQQESLVQRLLLDLEKIKIIDEKAKLEERVLSEEKIKMTMSLWTSNPYNNLMRTISSSNETFVANFKTNLTHYQNELNAIKKHVVNSSAKTSQEYQEMEKIILSREYVIKLRNHEAGLKKLHYDLEKDYQKYQIKTKIFLILFPLFVAISLLMILLPVL